MPVRVGGTVLGDNTFYKDNNGQLWAFHDNSSFEGDFTADTIWATTNQYGGVATDKIVTRSVYTVVRWIDRFVLNYLADKAAGSAVDAASEVIDGKIAKKGWAVTPDATKFSAPPPSKSTTPELLNPEFGNPHTLLASDLPTVPRLVAVPVSAGLAAIGKLTFSLSWPVAIGIAVVSYLIQRSGNILNDHEL